jgi:hypothetical protein
MNVRSGIAANKLLDKSNVTRDVRASKALLSAVIRFDFKFNVSIAGRLANIPVARSPMEFSCRSISVTTLNDENTPLAMVVRKLFVT